jgi:gliding motility-associated-like protein
VVRTPCASSHIYVPNAFSPNNDGKNDKLFVRGNFIQDLYFTVYDRWGQKMFETRDINTGWDGTFHGTRQDPAVFGWYAEGTCESGEKYFQKGNVTLLR